MFVVSVLIQGLESRMYEEFLEIFFFFFLKTTCDKNWQKIWAFPYKRLPKRSADLCRRSLREIYITALERLYRTPTRMADMGGQGCGSAETLKHCW